jgi:ABC-type multidrug transport system fused ATPase/permease subunit
MRFNITDYFRRLIKQPPQRWQQKQQELDVVNSSSKADITQYYYYDVAKIPEISDYLEKRFIPMFQWYKNKTKLNMRQFFIWRVSTIILTLFIIIFNVIALGYAANRSASSSAIAGIGIASSIAAALILGFTTLLQLTKAHENWMLYSRTFERLEREYHLFMLKASPYSINVSDDKSKTDKLFVENIENIILNQGSEFRSQRNDEDDASTSDRMPTTTRETR